MTPADFRLNPQKVRLEKRPEMSIWCSIRQRWMVYTPEEVVRQSLLLHLIDVSGYSPNHIAVEKQILIGQARRRFDIVVYDRQMQAQILVECKSPDVAVDDKTIKQLLQYNLEIGAEYLVLTNGVESYVYDTQNQKWLSDIPTKDEVNSQ